MELHEELGVKLRQARKECIHINGLIRKLRSLKAILRFNKETAFNDLDAFVEKMYENLKAFRYARNRCRLTFTL